MSYENETEETKYDESFFENIALTIFNHLNLDAYFIFESITGYYSKTVIEIK